jgi:Ca2+-binding EF-hand superfamily protein
MLAQKHDFNLRDAFEIFDVPRYGQIDAYQIRTGLNAINVFPSHEDVELFITRWDKNGDRRIAMREFEDAFLAHDSYYASMVTRRPSNYTPRPIRRDDCFLPATAFEFQTMWRTHFRVEQAAETVRQRLASRPGFNCYEAFNSLDLNGDGSIGSSELKRMIESRGYFIGFKEIDNVIDKMDKNKDGRVSFSEFRDETLPKSPARR